MAFPRTLWLILPVLLSASSARAGDAGSEMGGIGGLLVAPTRIEIGSRERAAEITMVNRGTATTTYRLSLVNMRMTDDGRLEEMQEDAAPPWTAENLVTFSPRQVTLRPEESQRVRLLVRRPADLPDGEYRSHLTFRIVPPATEEPPPGPTGSSTTRVRLRLIGLPGVSIPILVQQGNLAATATVSNVEVTHAPGTPSASAIRFRLNRQGNRGLYGDVQVSLVGDRSTSSQTIGTLRGVAVYASNAERTVEVPIQPPLPLAPGARLRVAYENPSDDGGSVFAEALIRAP